LGEEIMANLFKMQQNMTASNPQKANLRIVVILTFTIIAITVTYTTFAALTKSSNVHSTGEVNATANLSLYSDSACQTTLTSIDWGKPNPGTSVTRVIYIKNTGSGTSLSLGLTTSNWRPANADGPIAFSMDKTGTRLNPGQSTTATITLTISPTIVDITNYNLDMTITGTQ
jgi:hypothetical protein